MAEHFMNPSVIPQNIGLLAKGIKLKVKPIYYICKEVYYSNA
jgi:hypothetical protein